MKIIVQSHYPGNSDMAKAQKTIRETSKQQTQSQDPYPHVNVKHTFRFLSRDSFPSKEKKSCRLAFKVKQKAANETTARSH